jgi:hypothetical protein
MNQIPNNNSNSPNGAMIEEVNDPIQAQGNIFVNTQKDASELKISTAFPQENEALKNVSPIDPQAFQQVYIDYQELAPVIEVISNDFEESLIKHVKDFMDAISVPIQERQEHLDTVYTIPHESNSFPLNYPQSMRLFTMAMIGRPDLINEPFFLNEFLRLQVIAWNFGVLIIEEEKENIGELNGLDYIIRIMRKITTNFMRTKKVTSTRLPKNLDFTLYAKFEQLGDRIKDVLEKTVPAKQIPGNLSPTSVVSISSWFNNSNVSGIVDQTNDPTTLFNCLMNPGAQATTNNNQGVDASALKNIPKNTNITKIPLMEKNIELSEILNLFHQIHFDPTDKKLIKDVPQTTNIDPNEQLDLAIPPRQKINIAETFLLQEEAHADSEDDKLLINKDNKKHKQLERNCDETEKQNLYDELVRKGIFMPAYSSHAITVEALKNCNNKNYIVFYQSEIDTFRDSQVVLFSVANLTWNVLQKTIFLKFNKLMPFAETPDVVFIKKLLLFIDSNNTCRLWKFPKTSIKTKEDINAIIHEKEGNLLGTAFELSKIETKIDILREEVLKEHEIMNLNEKMKFAWKGTEYDKLFKIVTSGDPIGERMKSYRDFLDIGEVRWFEYKNFSDKFFDDRKTTRCDNIIKTNPEIIVNKNKMPEIDLKKLSAELGTNSFQRFIENNKDMEFSQEQLGVLKELSNDFSVKFETEKKTIQASIKGFKPDTFAAVTDALAKSVTFDDLVTVKKFITKVISKSNTGISVSGKKNDIVEELLTFGKKGSVKVDYSFKANDAQSVVSNLNANQALQDEIKRFL